MPYIRLNQASKEIFQIRTKSNFILMQSMSSSRNLREARLKPDMDAVRIILFPNLFESAVASCYCEKCCFLRRSLFGPTQCGDNPAVKQAFCCLPNATGNRRRNHLQKYMVHRNGVWFRIWSHLVVVVHSDMHCSRLLLLLPPFSFNGFCQKNF